MKKQIIKNLIELWNEFLLEYEEEEKQSPPTFITFMYWLNQRGD